LGRHGIGVPQPGQSAGCRKGHNRGAGAGRCLHLEPAGSRMNTIDLSKTPVRELNQRLHDLTPDTNERLWRVTNLKGEHALAVGLTVPIEVEIDGHVGYYCAGM